MDVSRNIKCDNCQQEYPFQDIQNHVKEKHAVRWVRDSILCLTEGIARVEAMVGEKFEQLESLVWDKFQEEVAGSAKDRENPDCTECGKNTPNIEKLRNELAKTQAEKFLAMSNPETRIRELEKKLNSKSEVVEDVKSNAGEINKSAKKVIATKYPKGKKVSQVKLSPKMVKEAKGKSKNTNVPENVKNVQCHNCDKNFCSKKDLNEHTKNHHKAQV